MIAFFKTYRLWAYLWYMLSTNYVWYTWGDERRNRTWWALRGIKKFKQAYVIDGYIKFNQVKSLIETNEIPHRFYHTYDVSSPRSTTILLVENDEWLVIATLKGIAPSASISPADVR